MLTYSDPFRSLDQWLDQLSSKPTGGAPLDAYRRGDDFWLHLDLPGVAADSLDIDLDRNVLTVSAERKWRSEDGDKIFLAERRQGRFSRQVHLGDGLDVDGIEADYHDGVLTIRIPVAERAKPRKVAINTGEVDAPVIEAETADA